MALTIMALAFLASCGGNKKQDTETTELPIQSSEVIDLSMNDEHNARNSLDYQGTYKGTLPMADGPGRDVTVVLTDSTYSRTSVISKTGDKEVEEGKYEWDAKGSKITLLGAEPSNQYFVAEGKLITLDIEGNVIEGNLAEHYVLTKE